MVNIKRKEYNGGVLPWRMTKRVIPNVCLELIIQIWGWFTQRKFLKKTRKQRMSEKTEKRESAQIIQGPWKKRKQKNLEAALEIQEALRFSEELAEECMLQMIQTFAENEIDISEKSFIRDAALLIEMTKGSIYRSLDLKHPTQGLFENLVELTVDIDNSVATEVNEEVLEEYYKLFGDDDDDSKN